MLSNSFWVRNLFPRLYFFEIAIGDQRSVAKSRDSEIPPTRGEVLLIGYFPRKPRQRRGQVDGYSEYRQMSPRWGLGLGWIIFLHRCRPAGAKRGGHRDATQMPPRWGLGLGWIIFLHRCRPAGAKSGHRDATQMPPRWGLGLGWIIFLHRCRHAGATEGWASQCYTDAAPLGLGFGVYRFSTQMSPRWGYGGVGIAMLHRCRPAGAKERWHRITIHISPRWGSKKDGVIVFYTDFAQVGNQNPLCK